MLSPAEPSADVEAPSLRKLACSPGRPTACTSRRAAKTARSSCGTLRHGSLSSGACPICASLCDSQTLIADHHLPSYQSRKGLITSIKFCPTDNAVAYTTNTGGVFSWRDPVPADRAHPVRTPSKAQNDGPRHNGAGDDLFGEGEDGEDLLDDDAWIEDDGDGEYKERAASVGFGGCQEVGEWPTGCERGTCACAQQSVDSQ